MQLVWHESRRVHQTWFSTVASCTCYWKPYRRPVHVAALLDVQIMSVNGSFDICHLIFQLRGTWFAVVCIHRQLSWQGSICAFLYMVTERRSLYQNMQLFTWSEMVLCICARVTNFEKIVRFFSPLCECILRLLACGMLPLGQYKMTVEAQFDRVYYIA